MKNKTEKTLRSHPVKKDENGRYYCRAMNLVTDIDFFLCNDCPLFNGFISGCPDCRYYDAGGNEDNEEFSPPDLIKKKVDALIKDGDENEFPFFLPDEERDKYGVMEKAIIYAAKAHKGAKRKGSSLPYIIHPMETMMLTKRMTDDPEVCAAAALHDVIEDTDKGPDDIKKEFGERIYRLVDLESENKREGLPKEDTWEIRKRESLEREKDAPYEAKIIMLSDKVSNMRATLRDYRRNGRKIWEKFNMKDEGLQEWYYRGVSRVLSSLSGLPAYKEYLSILDEVFKKD